MNERIVKEYQGRQPLPFWLFLIIGGVISIYAQIVKQSPEADKAAMQLFTYIGIGFVLVGLIKWLIKHFKGRKNTTTEQRFAEHLAGVDNINKQEQNIINKAPYVMHCPRCRTKNYSTSNYCHMCGQRLH